MKKSLLPSLGCGGVISSGTPHVTPATVIMLTNSASSVVLAEFDLVLFVSPHRIIYSDVELKII
jgi:hypothetical protein